MKNSILIEKSIYLTLIYATYSLVSYLLGVAFMLENSWLNWIFFLISFGVSILLVRQVRQVRLTAAQEGFEEVTLLDATEKKAGFYPFGRAFLDFFIILTVAALLNSLLSAFLYLVIEPEAHEVFIQLSEAKILAENPNMQGAGLEVARDMMAIFSPFRPIGMLIGVFSAAVGNAVIALIGAAILKK
ncbi:DUF4199 domain-containing protein [Hugenholtzia roseola]|uniref:DUF4199 domain-containing protein n=1 Tax=Hugenholtzia roseola TaxID=1002 RepID=UPI000479902E|nr:DUF4199 domain-containing protein [Hugenholtzia roseola]